MRNYIILNNQNSNTISGLIIQELAPISKPLQRTQVETIDGRDGDIVTPLGYAAYNKKIKIGLYGNFDINEVIAYFATKGTAIFSNEPDKYYYYQIVDQIDYERLVRYRVATVTMHVQPFKYSATEGTITVDASDTVSGEGSNIALDGTAEAPFNILRHKGNATQKTLSGKNLFNTNDFTTHSSSGITTTWSGNVGTASGTTTSTSFIATDTVSTNIPAGTYTFSVQTAIPYNTVIALYNPDASSWVNTNVLSANQLSVTFSINFTASGWRIGVSSVTTGTTISNLKIDRPMLESGSTATDFEQYCGGVPSPNPDYPQDIQVVTGDSTVKITGKNLLDPSSLNPLVFEGKINNHYYYDAKLNYFVEAGKTYTLSLNVDKADVVPYVFSILLGAKNAASPSVEVQTVSNITTVGGRVSITFTVTQEQIDRAGGNMLYMRIPRYRTQTTSNYKLSNIQLELSNQATDYEEFKGQSYVIPFGDTYLAKIGDYADEPVKVGDTWYIRRAVGKVVLDGSETGWAKSYGGTPNFFYRYREIADYAGIRNTDNLWLSDKMTPANIASNSTVFGGMILGSEAVYHDVRIRYGTEMATADWQAYLATNPITIYYASTTPTDEAITDQDLIDALDELYDQAHAYKGHTHITATAADGNAPAVLAVDVNEDNESTVTNAGNTTSRPILTIYGQGDIGVYINDVEVLDVALGDEGYITLDSVEMEAYKDTTANLKNRLVTGDYSKLALNAGANKIYFTGKVTKYEISKYSRWL